MTTNDFSWLPDVIYGGPIETSAKSDYYEATIKFDPAVANKFDQNKTRIELFPGDVLFAISDILTFGANKYCDRNWELGMDWSRAFGALMRHLWKWWQREAVDVETGRSHLWHAGCCLVFLIAYEARAVGKDDRP